MVLVNERLIKHLIVSIDRLRLPRKGRALKQTIKPEGALWIIT